MFNESHSLPGQGSLGFEHPFAAHLWDKGHAVVVPCTAPDLTWRNGCGGQGTWTLHGSRRHAYALRAESSVLVRAAFRSEFPSLAAVHAAREQMQATYDRNHTLRRQVESLYGLLPAGCAGVPCGVAGWPSHVTNDSDVASICGHLAAEPMHYTKLRGQEEVTT
jgi:hypothetical protein